MNNHVCWSRYLKLYISQETPRNIEKHLDMREWLGGRQEIKEARYLAGRRFEPTYTSDAHILTSMLSRDPWNGGNSSAAARALLATGAACHVLLLGSENTEALTGPAAVKRAVSSLLLKKVNLNIICFLT